MFHNMLEVSFCEMLLASAQAMPESAYPCQWTLVSTCGCLRKNSLTFNSYNDSKGYWSS